jgi:hypothetical protein
MTTNDKTGDKLAATVRKTKAAATPRRTSAAKSTSAAKPGSKTDTQPQGATDAVDSYRSCARVWPD